MCAQGHFGPGHFPSVRPSGIRSSHGGHRWTQRQEEEQQDDRNDRSSSGRNMPTLLYPQVQVRLLTQAARCCHRRYVLRQLHRRHSTRKRRHTNGGRHRSFEEKTHNPRRFYRLSTRTRTTSTRQWHHNDNGKQQQLIVDTRNCCSNDSNTPTDGA